ncbi:uncharacterized protein LOC130138018 [Syzygium oleosum]|uniref:uncharacterized protein LOC130138018 n=1 Tax=Syzygium oleosum TaxID=219896 RepID=UPI0024BB1096|nr:uncharacterized protein LOC130138018 [Syzygium oleosum]
MGGLDIRFVPTPKLELKKLWSQLKPDGQQYVLKCIGFMLPILDIDVQSGIMQALAHFWCPETTTFVLGGKFELTPTLEEYSIAIGKSIELDIVEPPIKVDPVVVLAEFLNLTKKEIEKVLKGNCQACPLSFLIECFENNSVLMRSKIFILVFFGLIIFPFRQNAIDPVIAWMVKQICGGVSFINTILAETFISLTRFKKGKDRTFRAPIELLQIWLFSHLSKFGKNMTVFEMGMTDNPILRFKQIQDQTKSLHYTQWVHLFKDPNSKIFLWQAVWFREVEAQLYHGDQKHVPLMGIYGVTCYQPLRVTRQFRVLQDVPPLLRPNEFQVQFEKGESYRVELRHHSEAWQNCSTQKLIWPADEPTGRMKRHFTTARYVQYHTIPAEILPKIPVVTVRHTLQTQIKISEKKAMKAQDKADALAEENARLRRALKAHSSIDHVASKKRKTI